MQIILKSNNSAQLYFYTICYSIDSKPFQTIQWSGLGKAGGDNVIILPGVTVSEAQQFVDILYGVRKVLSNKHFTVIEDTAVTEEFVCNNNSDCKDIKLEPYEI